MKCLPVSQLLKRTGISKRSVEDAVQIGNFAVNHFFLHFMKTRRKKNGYCAPTLNGHIIQV